MSKYEITEYRDVEHYSQLPSQLVERVAECIQSGFGGTIEEQDLYEHVSGGQVLVAQVPGLDPYREVAGFSATVLASPADAFNDSSHDARIGGYFAGSAIAADHQSHGLYHQLFDRRARYALEDPEIDFLYTRTQNPRVLDGLTHGVERLLAVRKIRGYRMAKAIIMRHAYPSGMLTREVQHSKEHHDFEKIDPHQGDAYVFRWDLDR